MTKRTNLILVGLGLCLGLAACRGERDRGTLLGAPEEQAARDGAGGAGPAPIVDSVIPMDVALARLREGVEEPARLEGGAGSRDALVRSIIDAMAAADTAAFETLALDLGGFAWLYYPSNPLSRPPYALPPALAWFRLQEGNRRGVFRLLREFGGRELDDRGYRCAPEPAVEGDNRIWSGCVVTIGRDGQDPVTLALFSSLLERDGRWVVLSYENDF